VRKQNSQLLGVAFRFRGWLLGSLALLVLISSRPTATSITLALPFLILGLFFRGWAFAHLGSRGRTRDPSPPPDRVVRGPYKWLNHPVYAANVLVALGILLAAAPGYALGLVAGGFVLGLYGMLALREQRQMKDVPIRRSGALLSVLALARCERSSWLTVALLLVFLVVRAL